MELSGGDFWRSGSETEDQDPDLNMTSSRCSWIALLLLSVVVGLSGVFGRPSGAASRTDALTRWRRGAAETHRERCAELTAPWHESNRRARADNTTLLQLRVRPFTPPRGAQGLVFPGKSLFGFIRRVYRCCQDGVRCRSVKGIQGRQRGDTDVEFLLSRDILSLTVMRAELHLQLSNPQHLDIHPVLSSLEKRDLPTRFSWWSRGSTVELRVDLLFLFQGLQEAAAAGGGARGGPSLANMRRVAFPPGQALRDTDGDALELGLVLGLVLGCSQAGSGVSCGGGGVHLSHTPFMALYYR